MSQKLEVTIEAWPDRGPIPATYAMGVPAREGHAAFGPNTSPPIRWSGEPEGTRSFAILCVDIDVPSRPDDVNKEGRIVPPDLPRADFYHWVLVDIPADRHALPIGADSDGVTPRGKPVGATPNGVRGANDYTSWFAGDEVMKGTYGGYDGPFPPWNDSILHHYHFRVHALDIPGLGLIGAFRGPDVLKALEGHVLAEGAWVGTYTLNPALDKR